MAEIKQSVIEDDKFRKGDKVIVKGNLYHRLNDGAIGEVTHDSLSNSVYVSSIHHHFAPMQGKPLIQSIFPQDLKLITTNMQAKKDYDSIQDGDYATISQTGYHGFAIGTGVKVINAQGKGGLPGIYLVEPIYLSDIPKGKSSQQWVAFSHLTKQENKNQIKTNNMSKKVTTPAITETQLKLNAMSLSNQERKDIIEEQANDLMARDGKITTLDLKKKLRLVYPTILWNQYTTSSISGVSDLFHDLVREGKFKSIADNGTYQTYVPTKQVAKAAKQLGNALTQASKTSTNTAFTTSTSTTQAQASKASAGSTLTSRRGLVKGSATALAAGKAAAATRARNKAVTSNQVATPKQNTVAQTPKVASIPGAVRVGKKDLRDRILNSKGIISVTFIKQDGTERTLAGVVVKDQKELGLGYIMMKDLVKTKKEGKEVIRQANIQTTKSAKINRVTYQVK